MSAKSKKNAEIVDNCLSKLLGSNTQITLTAILLNQWENAVKKHGLLLSPRKIEIALKNLGIRVIKVTECADEFICNRGWEEFEFA